jgi:ankyrin repeat protein
MMECPLIQAVLDENVEVVIQLLAQGADPNAFEDADKIRPLHFAAQKKSAKSLEIARLLVQAGADPSAQTYPDGQTPIDVAFLMSTPEMVVVLLQAQKERLH